MLAVFYPFSIDARHWQFRLPHMIKSGANPSLPGIKSLIRLACVFGFAIAALSAVAATVPADQPNPDEQFIHIMGMIDRADVLRTAGQLDAARAEYREAQTNLVMFKAYNPLFDPKTVTYRLNEVTARVDARPPVVESAAPVSHANRETAPAASKSKSAVKLIDPGAEPRQVLRLHVKPGDKQMVIMTVKMNIDMGMAIGGTNGSRAMDIPAMNMPMDVTIESVAPNGDIAYQAVFEEPGVVTESNTPPQAAQMMKMALGKIKGMTCDGVISSRGVSKSVDVKVPPDADPQMRQSIEQIKQSMHNVGTPMPEEAIGAGAKWEIKMPVKSQGMSIDQTADYQLASVQGDKVNTTFTLTQTAANQKIQNPSMGNVQMTLLQYTGNGTGSVTTDLSKLMALQANMNMQIDLNSQVTVGTKTQPMNMKMGMDMTLESQ
ncbi:MAG TPA: hypothetical protein VG938_04520 [Verrucomicrobiae bacterium]|jgi:hypothetical protein|nr:hypothetical protein [Verrucomicrobiae bacterium]